MIATAVIAFGFTQLDDFLALPASDRAAWVGALGSILALAVAGLVAVGTSAYGTWQTRKENFEAARHRQLAALSVLHALSEQLIEIANLLRPGASPEVVDICAAMIEGYRNIFKGIPLSDFNDDLAIVEFSSMPGVLSAMEIGLRNAKILVESSSESVWRPRLMQEAELIEDQARGIMERVVDCCTRNSLRVPARFRRPGSFAEATPR